MKKYDVEMALEGLREARQKWRDARREFVVNSDKVLDRLILEAAANHMSVSQVARYSGESPTTIRRRMDLLGMHAKMRKSKRLLADHAATALAENSALLGIAPHQMDLMSPLAYLPMGSEMRQALTDQTTAGVTDLPDEETADEAIKRLALFAECEWCDADITKPCVVDGEPRAWVHPSRRRRGAAIFAALHAGATLSVSGNDQ